MMEQKAELKIVGDGEEHANIEDLISSLNLKNVTLVGKKTGKELVNEYKNADIFVLSSYKEGGAPLVLLEAMASGLPSIVTNIYGIYELLGDSVMILDNDTDICLARALDKVLFDKKLQVTLSKKASEMAKKFGWDESISMLEEIYNTIDIA